MLQILLHVFEIVVLRFQLSVDGGELVSSFVTEGNLFAIAVE